MPFSSTPLGACLVHPPPSTCILYFSVAPLWPGRLRAFLHNTVEPDSVPGRTVRSSNGSGGDGPDTGRSHTNTAGGGRSSVAEAREAVLDAPQQRGQPIRATLLPRVPVTPVRSGNVIYVREAACLASFAALTTIQQQTAVLHAFTPTYLHATKAISSLGTRLDWTCLLWARCAVMLASETHSVRVFLRTGRHCVVHRRVTPFH